MVHKTIDPFENFKEAKLKNGISVYYSEIQKPWIKTQVIVHAGAKDDRGGKYGTAHFLEHLLSHNVEGITNKEIEEYFDEIGGSASFGSTGYEETGYSFSVPLENDNLKYALNFFGSMLFESKLEKFIERERQIIIGEYNERFPIPLAEEMVRKRREVLFKGHKLAGFLRPLGNLPAINTIQREDILEYYNRCYTPKNITIIASGGILLEEFLDILENSNMAIQKEGERIPKPEPLSELPGITETSWHKSHTEVFQEKPHQASIMFCVGLPGSVPDKTLSLALNVIGQTLYHEIREKRGWSYSLNFHSLSFPEAYDIYVDIDYPWEYEQEIEGVIDDCIEQTILDTKMIERHKRRSINSFKISDQNVSGILSAAHGDIVEYGYIKTYAEELRDRESVQISDVKELLKKFKKGNRFTMTLGS